MRIPDRRLLSVLAATLLASSLLHGCAAKSGKAPRAELDEMKVQKNARQKPLRRNHFNSDRSRNISERELDEILDAPLVFQENARLGIVPVANGYRTEGELPLDEVPKALNDAIETTDYFSVTTEVSTDWPVDGNIAGLRELAARYRAEYLLLYRQRFVDRHRVNAWGWTWPTVVGLFATPGKTVDMAGVLEATLFDVRNGTILFTVYERVRDHRQMNIWHNEYKKHKMQRKLMTRAGEALTDKVTHKLRNLVVASREFRRENESARR